MLTDPPRILDRYGLPFQNPSLPDFGIKLTTVRVRKTARKLKTLWSTQAADDLRDLMQPETAFAKPSAIDRLAAIPFNPYRQAAEHIAQLPEDLIPADVKDIALGNMLDLIPEKHWPSDLGSSTMDWDSSVLGKIVEVIENRERQQP